MSMIQKLINDLESLKERLVERRDAAIVDDAIDTIQVQSAKLAAHNLHGRWIPVDEAHPANEETWALVCHATGNTIISVDMGCYLEGAWFAQNVIRITHWMELPKLPEIGGTE